ncbi:PREDICTED: uncharacterized protein LOC108692710 [Atta colombica]|uniref:uncharacterized protein LOC108692710 n=1 Tax=Atta colombica TaxID=520822 RepID=UPI00084C562A|nr:PREDICTED: uncharacterized protein LOC108692710 [Atta colombica]
MTLEGRGATAAAAITSIKLVSIQFIFLSEEASAKCIPRSKLEEFDEEEGEGRELDSIRKRATITRYYRPNGYLLPSRCRKSVPPI